MEITFPANCTTEASRMAWCYRAQEKLRKLHNWIGVWYREGIAESIYNQFPVKIKNRYDYSAKLSQAQWSDFQTVFDSFSNAIIEELLKARQESKDSDFWSPDFDGDIN